MAGPAMPSPPESPVSYVLEGKRVGDHAATGILDKIAVGPAGRTDPTEIQLLGQRWLRQQ